MRRTAYKDIRRDFRLEEQGVTVRASVWQLYSGDNREGRHLESEIALVVPLLWGGWVRHVVYQLTGQGPLF